MAWRGVAKVGAMVEKKPGGVEVITHATVAVTSIRMTR
jgi:hypothetical protein